MKTLTNIESTNAICGREVGNRIAAALGADLDQVLDLKGDRPPKDEPKRDEPPPRLPRSRPPTKPPRRATDSALISQ